MASMTDASAGAVLAAYLKQHGAGMTAAQIRTISIAQRAAQYRSWTVAELQAALRDTLPLGAADPKPIRMIGPDSAAYILSVL